MDCEPWHLRKMDVKAEGSVASPSVKEEVSISGVNSFVMSEYGLPFSRDE